MILNIITVTKDDIEGLGKTIESTKNFREKYDVCQIIIDSSIDENKNKIISYLQNEKNIQYFWQNPSGIAAAFNFGLKNAEAEWIWFLNGGDEIHENLDYEFFLNFLSRNSSDAIIFQIESIPSSLIPRHPQMWALWPPTLSWIPHPSTITRRYLYERYGMFNESLNIAMDYEYWIRCFSNDVIVDLVSIPIAKFDQSGSSFGANRPTKTEVRKILIKYMWLILKKWLENGLIFFKSLKATYKIKR